MNKSDSDKQKRSSVFQEKINRGDTAELTADRRTVMATKGRQFFSGKIGVTPSCATRGDGPTHFFLNRALLRLNPARHINSYLVA